MDNITIPIMMEFVEGNPIVLKVYMKMKVFVKNMTGLIIAADRPTVVLTIAPKMVVPIKLIQMGMGMGMPVIIVQLLSMITSLIQMGMGLEMTVIIVLNPSIILMVLKHLDRTLIKPIQMVMV